MFRPLPPDFVEMALEKIGLQPKSYILHVGTIEPRKNLVRLVEAYHRVRQEMRPPAPKLVLAGSTGWFFRDVFDRIEALDLKDEVIFLGRVTEEQLPALYNGALFLVLPSLYEGFGLPALEAMACGLPVIASNASSLPEVVAQAGILVDPYDTGALATSIATLVEDAGLRDELSKAGQEQAKKFSWERVAQETIAVYKNVVGQ